MSGTPHVGGSSGDQNVPITLAPKGEGLLQVCPNDSGGGVIIGVLTEDRNFPIEIMPKGTGRVWILPKGWGRIQIPGEPPLVRECECAHHEMDHNWAWVGDPGNDDPASPPGMRLGSPCQKDCPCSDFVPRGNGMGAQ